MRKHIMVLWVILLSFFTFMMPDTQAQDAAIEFPGEIVAIDGNIISVGGIAVDVSNAILPGDGLSEGMTVQVIGTRQEQTIVATIIIIIDFGTPATPPPEMTPEVTADPEMTPEVTVEPETTEEPESTETPVPPIVIDTDGAPIIVIEGPVQAISVNYITIFDIDIEVDASDPILTQIRIGDTIRVEGESSFEGNTIIIVAVNITIVQTTIIVVNNPGSGAVYIPALPPNCKRTKKGKVTCKKNTKKNTKKTSKKSKKSS